jgi:tetratricopeptide (TPR) repeat protein
MTNQFDFDSVSPRQHEDAMIDNLLSWWNLLLPEDRVKIIAGALATILIGILTFFSNSIIITIKRVFTKNEPAPASTAQATQQMSQSQQVIVNIPPQPIIIREELLPRGEGAGDHAGSPLRNAPIPRTPQYGFVPRYDDQGNDLAARVSQLLKQDCAVALVGSGGVGKTMLAAEIARAFLPSPAASGGRAGDGGRVVWASADGRADFALTTLLDEAAAQLGSADLRTLALEQKTNAVRNLLSESRALIVLDNFETIAVEQQKAIAAFVNTLSGPALITSRLAVEGTDRVGVGAMSPEEARDFLARLIAHSPKRNALTPLIGEIAERAERNPMVMRWIVGQLELAQRMSDVLDELSHGAGDAATRVFGRSFGLLNADAQAALLSLALCVPSANRAALAFTAGFGDDIKRLNTALKPLAGLQLLETDEKSERLSVVGLTRRFTSAQLDKDSNAAEYRKRFVDYFVRNAEAHPETTPEDLDALEVERENLLAAMDLAFAAQDWQSVMRVADTIIPGKLFYVHGYWDDAIARGEQAAEAARRAGDDWHIGAFANAIGGIHTNRGEYELAKKHYEQAVEIAKKLNEQQGLAATLHHLGTIAYLRGDYETAHQHHAEGFEIEKKLGDQSGIAKSLRVFGMIAQDQGDYETARQRYAESLEIEKNLGNQSGIAQTLHNLGAIAQQQGDYEMARQRYAESLEINRKLGSQSGIANTLHQLGMIAQDQGDYGTARQRYAEGLEAFKNLGAQREQAAVLHQLGTIAQNQGDYETARQRYAESLEIKRRLGNQSGIALTYGQMGLLAEKEGNKGEAARLFREALEIFERLKSPYAVQARKDLERVEGGQRTTTD